MFEDVHCHLLPLGFAWQQAALHLKCGKRNLGGHLGGLTCLKGRKGENFDACFSVGEFMAYALRQLCQL